MLIVKNVLFTLIVPGFVVGFIPIKILLPGWEICALNIPHGRYIGVLFLVLGGAVYARCVWDFAWTGKGTPAPIDPPRTLIVGGLYRYVRNPMYVGILTILLGEAIFLESTTLCVYTISIWGMFNVFILVYEEPHLRAVFGASYVRYSSQVPRWIPAIFRPFRNDD